MSVSDKDRENNIKQIERTRREVSELISEYNSDPNKKEHLLNSIERSKRQIEKMKQEMSLEDLAKLGKCTLDIW